MDQIRSEQLARSYIQIMAEVEASRIRLRSQFASDSSLVVEDEDETNVQVEPTTSAAMELVRLPVDNVAIAILVAKMIASESDLTARIDKDALVVVLATHENALVARVQRIFEKCVIPPDLRVRNLTPTNAEVLGKGDVCLVVRDGSHRDDTPNHGNEAVRRALHARVPIFGIAPNPKQLLPRDLLRAADYELVLPPLDEDVVELVVEIVTRERATKRIDADLVRLLEVDDLPVALRNTHTADDAIDSISRMLAEKVINRQAGPSLEQLDGYGAAKEWGLRLAADIQLYRAGLIAWDDVDGHGLLLSGPSGVGKTAFARALARTVRVPLIATSVAAWNGNDHLGQALRAMREVFARASAKSPSILFIDEIDGISDRGRIGGEYSTYWTQIVNALLELLAGVEDRPGVVVIAATNYPERVDAAVKRSGRLDREIRIEKPDAATLCKIFRFHLGSETVPDPSLMQLALAARGATGADVQTWVRRARGVVRRAGRKLDLDDLLTQIRDGRHPMRPDERRRAAFHEAGHVVVCRALGLGTIVDLSLHDGGGEMVLEHDISGCSTLSHLEAIMAGILAGRVAEQLELGETSIGGGLGSSSDLARATTIASDIELKFGLGFLGPVHIDIDGKDLLLIGGLLSAVSKRLRDAEKHARLILTERRHEMQAVAEALQGAGYLSGPEIADLMSASVHPVPTSG